MLLSQCLWLWSVATFREKLIKIGAKIVRHTRYVTFQMSEVAIPCQLIERFCGGSDG